ncbi:universal stress protein [Saliphagus sp. GCM10025308]
MYSRKYYHNLERISKYEHRTRRRRRHGPTSIAARDRGRTRRRGGRRTRLTSHDHDGRGQRRTRGNRPGQRRSRRRLRYGYDRKPPLPQYWLAREALETVEGEIDFTVVPKIVDANTEATAILDAAEEHGCDHIFLVGRKRSRTGKALFGSLAQTIMLTFDGQVTVELE